MAQKIRPPFSANACSRLKAPAVDGWALPWSRRTDEAAQCTAHAVIHAKAPPVKRPQERTCERSSYGSRQSRKLRRENERLEGEVEKAAGSQSVSESTSTSKQPLPGSAPVPAPSQDQNQAATGLYLLFPFFEKMIKASFVCFGSPKNSA